ncbi:hypothetical protein [Pseudomonas sp. CGJS7]|uniref:hypothetical protein n=1 Tax=Pseudomonas sp. CGJS7 TaxID=3109348 RepID=UPI003008DE2C
MDTEKNDGRRSWYGPTIIILYSLLFVRDLEKHLPRTLHMARTGFGKFSPEDVKLAIERVLASSIDLSEVAERVGGLPYSNVVLREYFSKVLQNI